MKIRSAEVTDAEGIAYVGIKTWQTAYRGIFPDYKLDNLSMKENTEKWKDIIISNSKNMNLEMIVAEDSKAGIVGYAGGGKYETTPPFNCEIGGIYVLKEFQRRGYKWENIKITTECLNTSDLEIGKQ